MLKEDGALDTGRPSEGGLGNAKDSEGEKGRTDIGVEISGSK